MFKRTKGYLLLTLLVLTGLAGKTHTETLPTTERHALLTLLKSFRERLNTKEQEFFHGEQQRHAGNIKISKQQIYHLASLENFIWNQAKQSLHQATDQKDTESRIQTQILIRHFTQSLTFSSPSFRNPSEAILLLDHVCKEMIRYVRTTTENPKNHLITVGHDTLNVYQAIQVMTGIADNH